MKKEITLIDKERGIVRITSLNERFYARPITDKKTGLPAYKYVPSVTWICESFPKSTPFYKWLASKGWDEAEALKVAAGDKGSKVHEAINDLIHGKTINIDAKYTNRSMGSLEDLSVEEYECLLSFAQWVEDFKPKFLRSEFVVWGDGYAGTVDLLAELDGKTYIVDFKTGQYIWPSYELQLSAYNHAIDDKMEKKYNLAILQVGYRSNKKHYKWTELDDQYDLFLATKTIWQKQHGNERPHQIDLPMNITLKKENENARHIKAVEIPQS